MSASTPSQPVGPIITGLTPIGRLFNRSRDTVRRWILFEDFPACRLPNGEWVTSLALIDTWITARMAEEESEQED